MGEAIANIRSAFPGTEFADTVINGEHISTCKRCGCTERRSCPDGCHWLEPGLCSSHGEVA